MGFILGLQELDAGPADTLGDHSMSTCSELCMSCLSLVLCGDSFTVVTGESNA